MVDGKTQATEACYWRKLIIRCKHTMAQNVDVRDETFTTYEPDVQMKWPESGRWPLKHNRDVCLTSQPSLEPQVPEICEHFFLR